MPSNKKKDVSKNVRTNSKNRKSPKQSVSPGDPKRNRKGKGADVKQRIISEFFVSTKSKSRASNEDTPSADEKCSSSARCGEPSDVSVTDELTADVMCGDEVRATTRVKSSSINVATTSRPKQTKQTVGQHVSPAKKDGCRELEPTVSPVHRIQTSNEKRTTLHGKLKHTHVSLSTECDESRETHVENVHHISDSDSDSTQEYTPKLSATKTKPQLKTLLSSSIKSSRDTEAYRSGYTGKRDNRNLNDNWKFYSGQIESKPKGTFIDIMHQHWHGDYSLLEEHHGYIQWLFPIREQGMNWQAQELQPHEAKDIAGCQKAQDRVIKSYEMMLHFWGMRLQNKITGRIVRGENWMQRFRNLNRSFHNYLRITRVLKSLGELGLEHLKGPFLKFILHEALVTKTLVNAKRSCLHYWIHTVRDDHERVTLQKYADGLQSSS